MSDEEFRQAPQYFVNSAFPQFVRHPAGGTFIEGISASLSCAVDVSAPGLQLVWVVNDTEVVECARPKSNCVVVSNETSSTFSIKSFSASMEGSYQCIARNGNYTVASNAARLIRPSKYIQMRSPTKAVPCALWGYITPFVFFCSVFWLVGPFPPRLDKKSSKREHCRTGV